VKGLLTIRKENSYQLINTNIFSFLFSEDIVAIGTDDDIAREFAGIDVDKKIDASGCCILPGKNEVKIYCN
jgi:hypothetical protein